MSSSGRWTGFVVALGVLSAGVAAQAYGDISSAAQDGGVIEGEAPPAFHVELKNESSPIAAEVNVLAQEAATTAPTIPGGGTPLAASGPSGPSGPSAPAGPSGPGAPSGPSGPPVTQPNASAGVRRLQGGDRVATAITISQDAWTADEASVVVLARAENFPDALVGVPLAHNLRGPLLLVRRSVLDAAVLTEIKRVVPDGARIHILGGTDAVSATVEAEITGAGFPVTRYAGTDRFDTALKVAQALGSPQNVFLATGRNFPDALAAGAAAAKTNRAVLLTDDATVPAAVATYLQTATPIAIGGPSSRAVPSAQSIVGTDRYDTAFKLATQFFNDTPSSMGLATGENFPDGLSGGAHIATYGGPLLLTPTAVLHPGMAAVIDKLPTNGSLYLYGGTTALSADVETAAKAVLAN